jgi:hypothetical protein
MSDDLSPVEQARAAQWAANWLGDHGYDSHRLSGGDAVAALRWAVDELDPPETVESLRAERDEALAEMEEVGAAWRQEQIMHQKAWATIRILQAEVARLCDTHVDAEAARGRCARED